MIQERLDREWEVALTPASSVASAAILPSPRVYADPESEGAPAPE